MVTLFQPPDESLIAGLNAEFPCRDIQANARSLVVHGTGATGKSAIVQAILTRLASASGDGLRPSFAIVDSSECITTRHLLETAVAKVASALAWDHGSQRCESPAQLTVELCKMLQYPDRDPAFRFFLVFDAIDQQREAPSTLLPALARLPELIQCLTVVFIVTSPPAGVLRTSFVPHVHFPSYSKAELVQILSAGEPPSQLLGVSQDDMADLRLRFYGAVHDAVAKPAARTLPAFRDACNSLWPRFVAPIVAGTHGPREFSKLLVAARVHLQDESLLEPVLVAPRDTTAAAGLTSAAPSAPSKLPGQALVAADLAVLLPTTARLLLLAAYLASHNAARHDLTLFSTHHHGRRRRRGGGGAGRTGRGGARSKHRKIARKLLGAHAFVLERMMAIFAAVRSEWDGRTGLSVDADVGMALATLSRLRLLVRVGLAGDLMDRGGKWRVNVGWEIVRGLGRSMNIEVEEWLIE